jgi:glycosyltransferase involved in cell wall biosynthesis
MNKIKILYLVSTLRRTGPTNQLSYIIKYLNKTIYEPFVLTLSEEPTKDSMKNYFVEQLNLEVHSIQLSRLQGLFFAKSKIEEFIKKNKINLVHSQGIRADGLMSNINIPRVATLRNYPFYDYPMTYGKFQGYLMAKKHLKYLKKIDFPVVVSKSISEMLQKMNNYNIGYVRNGTDIERFQNLDKNNLREKLGIQKEKKIFISVGHLNSRKDPITIIKAFQKAKIENSQLIFLGDGNLKQECLSMSENQDIEFVGEVENVHEYLGASDYFISASLAEGLPNTVLEAMATCLPCLLSNIPPHIEIHEINPKSSLIFEIQDIEGLSIKLQEIINHNYQVMQKASKDIIFNYLSAEIMSQNYQNIYSKLLVNSEKAT